MKKIIWTFGIIAGLINICWMTSFFIMKPHEIDFENGELLGYSTMVLAFSMIGVAVYNYREKYNGGVITFGKAFKIGILITLVATTMYVMVWQIGYRIFMPDFGETYAKYALEKMRAAHASEQEIKTFQQQMEYYKNPVVNILFTYLEPLPVALPMTLIVALVMKRKTPKKAVVA